jgi:hypothetical protein
MAYATIEDLEARYGEVDADLYPRANALLDDAATMLEARVEVDASDPAQLARLRMVSCAMVNRALQAARDDAYGVSTSSYTMGPFTQSATYSNPSGDLYLTSGELRLLGGAGTVVASMRAEVRGGC